MSDLNPFHTGERVRITIDATVTWSDSSEIEYEYRSQLGTVEGKAALDSEAVKVERTAPLEWPPRPGDLWCNRKGVPWFAVATATGVRMTSKGGVPSLPDDVFRGRGPLSLVYREVAS